MLIKHMGTLINKVMLVRIHCNHQMPPSLQIKLDKVQIILAKKSNKYVIYGHTHTRQTSSEFVAVKHNLATRWHHSARKWNRSLLRVTVFGFWLRAATLY